jgi:uncharacterized radical SAM superfamily protein
MRTLEKEIIREIKEPTAKYISLDQGGDKAWLKFLIGQKKKVKDEMAGLASRT